MTQRFPAASIDDVRAALNRSRPDLATREIARLGEGWDFVTFTAGGYVVRVAKTDTLWTATGRLPILDRLQIECELLAQLAPTLPLPVPVPSLYTDGPHGLPLTIYEQVSGVSPSRLTRPPSADFGATLGRFIKALHAFPVDRAAAIGLDVMDGARTRQHRIDWYEMLARRVFPLLSCEARTHTIDRFETYLNDADNFAFEATMIHSDIDERNLLADPETGALTGVIDFGDSHIGDPAADFTWALLVGFENLGIGDQIPDLLREGGRTDAEIRQRCEFYKFCWPLHEILYGLDTEDAEVVTEGIQRLNETVPFGMRCEP